ncbi:Heme-degrading monooxygenase HmoA [Desulfocicer vacuolatum DSM 3385]|uniref:Heme-degrading monooxygenase HmoA n=1 Tax=Desulfocicer vacuolatum DSM 3385 TaxID=1121400 RepID=A0A1W2B717_9BACT|nr:antibiotic biosynthesis monooxygenase family protein [Desulfocicer vacuolatum]SMC68767.1 Heme-degrading monooxygenase HmoA [Desulfocicer vacuolatum DSM 3385]
MTIKVLIKRNIPKTASNELNLIFMEMRSAAMKQPGYIGGETLRRVDVPEKSLIISRWQTLDDWTRWLVSDERKQCQDRIDALVDIETKYEVYEN